MIMVILFPIKIQFLQSLHYQGDFFHFYTYSFRPLKAQNGIKPLPLSLWDEIAPRIAASVAIAIEHIVLRALDFGLRTCWIRLFESNKINQIFGWDDNIYVVALLPIGYPAEIPEARKRLSIQEITIE